MSGLIAIVGRPNVGKSALFNRIVRRRIAIVHDQPGVTRDRISAEAEWRGRAFTLVDTGGLGLLQREKANDAITRAAIEQVQLAIDAAQVILFVVDVQEGIVPLDREVADRLRQSGKPVIVTVNKVDTPKAESGVPEFAELGFDRILPIAAIHGRGIEPVVQAALDLLPAAQPLVTEPATTTGGLEAPSPEAGAAPIKLAIVGRPNVGKSSIINALTQSERVIVSAVPGTTRDAVDVPLEVETEGVRQPYVLIDTAGLRKARRRGDSIEFFSVKRAEDSIARADIIVLVMDAEQGVSEQDKKIGDRIVAGRKACIVVVNKWDLFADDVRKARAESKRVAKSRKKPAREDTGPQYTLEAFGQWVQRNLFFLDYAPVIFTSAKSGFHLERLLEAIRYVAAQLRQTIPTGILNRTLHDAVERHQPASASGQRLKFFYATQVRQAPPTFLFFVNRKDLFSDAYKKYLTREMRKAFGYEGCPILLVPKSRPQNAPEPIRKSRPSRRLSGRR